MTPDQTRTRILEAADGLFGTLGFDATTTRDIAERSGVNKALIHYHYGSKDELLGTLLDGYYARLGEALAPALARGGTPLEQVESVLDTYADFLAGNLTFCRIVQREVASGRHMERIVERTLPVMQLGVDWLSHRGPPPSHQPRGRAAAHQRLRDGGHLLHPRRGAAPPHRGRPLHPRGPRRPQAPRAHGGRAAAPCPHERNVMSLHPANQAQRERLPLRAEHWLCIERAQLYTAVVPRRPTGCTRSLRAARAFQNVFLNMSVRIEPDELLVGNRSSKLIAPPLALERGDFSFIFEHLFEPLQALRLPHRARGAGAALRRPAPLLGRPDGARRQAGGAHASTTSPAS